jgi:hypothetical protein
MDLVLKASSRATRTTVLSTIAAGRDRSREFDRISVGLSRTHFSPGTHAKKEPLCRLGKGAGAARYGANSFTARSNCANLLVSGICCSPGSISDNQRHILQLNFLQKLNAVDLVGRYRGFAILRGNDLARHRDRIPSAGRERQLRIRSCSGPAHLHRSCRQRRRAHLHGLSESHSGRILRGICRQ